VRSKGLEILCGVAALSFILGPAAPAQDEPPPTSQELRTGPASVSPHWSKNDYPESIPEGAPYVIVEKGDTLWDLAAEYLESAYLWPQIWDENKYITDAHWIYPGDPILLPQVAVVADRAGQLGPEGMPEEDEAMPAEYEPPAEAESLLYPVTEEFTMLCAGYIVPEREDDSLRIVGSEQGRAKNAFADRDILYLSKGSNSGVRTGDLYTIHAVTRTVKHPVTGKKLGLKVTAKGTARVVLVAEDTATIVVERACRAVYIDDYLLPYEPVSVPLALRQDPASRLTPPSGKAQGYVVDVSEGARTAATGHLVTVDIGSEAGLVPGNLLVAFRTVYPKVPTNRHVVAELAVVAVREQTAVAKVMYSVEEIESGDRVEIR